MDKHMSEPMIITLTDLSLAVFCNCVGYLEILVKFVQVFQELYGDCLLFLADLLL